MSDAQRPPLLEAAAISKRFGSIRALDEVSLRVSEGEVHGLLGANGAGKSTLIGVLSGAIKPDKGALRVAGKEAPLGSVSAARAAGLAVVHQELMLFPTGRSRRMCSRASCRRAHSDGPLRARVATESKRRWIASAPPLI